MTISIEPAGLPANPKTFTQELEQLLRDFSARTDNPSSIECSGCKNCVESTFCKNSRSLNRCHYCVDCERCLLSTHCRASADLLSANHCVACERCSHSSYMVKCFDCVNSTYCFGSVGLIGKDFHILNRPYSRGEYFAITGKLSAALRLT